MILFNQAKLSLKNIIAGQTSQVDLNQWDILEIARQARTKISLLLEWTKSKGKNSKSNWMISPYQKG